MPDIMVQIGHDVPLVMLNPVVPKPASEPPEPVQRLYGVNGTICHDQGACLKLHWAFVETETEYMTILAFFGLHDQASDNVTVYAKDERLVWKRFNGVSQLPEPGVDMRWANYFPRDITIYIVDLEELEEV